MINEFKKFILKGNVVDLSTGVIIGAAFGKIVGAFTDGIVNPLLNKLGGDPNVSLKLWIFDIGVIINAAISFLITAAIVFFVIVKPANTMMAKLNKPEPGAPPPPTPEDIVLLREIRDSLSKR